jgi:hypothetical protein
MAPRQEGNQSPGFLSSLISFTTGRLQGSMGPITNQVAPLVSGSNRSARNPRPADTSSQPRPSAPRPARRPPVEIDEVIILDSSDDDAERNARTAHTIGRKRKREDDSNANGDDTGTSRPSRRRNPPISFADEDIIIIDDD